METVFSDFILFVNFIRNTVHIGFLRHRGVESRIENRDHRHAFHNFPATFDARNIAGHMKWTEFGVLFADFNDFVSNHDRVLEIFAGVKNPVSHSAYFVHAFDTAVYGVKHRF